MSAEKIRELNNAMRKGLTRAMVMPNGAIAMPLPPDGGRVLMTPGFSALDPDLRIAFVHMIGADHPAPGDDPYREQDFGFVEHEGKKVYWKIDYLDRDFKYGSETPADPETTRRLLTIMLAEEY